MDLDIANVTIIVSLGIILVLSVLIIRKLNQCKTENFKKCVCSSREGRDENCQDTVIVNNNYVTGKLTENTNLPQRGWTTVSPGDINFPVSNGCGWSDNQTKSDGNKWQSWDFTDFGN